MKYKISMSVQINSGASHTITNNIIYGLIIQHISKDSKVLDFGSGEGYMSKQIGEYFENLGQHPNKQLHACEIAPENFLYDKIECTKIPSDSKIPFSNDTFDLIYSIEVVEHMPRPYDFFIESFNKLKSGGILIFSTPNISHFKSRLSFLFTGYPEMYGPLSIKDKNAGRICGHIMPLSFNNFHYGLRKAGFEKISFHVDRRKKGALIPALLMYPILMYAKYRVSRKLKKYDEEVFFENQQIVSFMNSIDALSSRSCIVIAQKVVV